MEKKKNHVFKDLYWKMPPHPSLALMLAKREVSTLVYDAVNLEGISYTLPEIQTLLDGVTVGGHKLSDQRIALNQASAWEFLFKTIESGNFSLRKKLVCDLHGIAAESEALFWGKFRDRSVTIAGTSYMPPRAEELNQNFKSMCEEASEIEDIYEKSIFVFLKMARNQFFFDVNKRMGRFLMNGMLLASGFPVINVPFKRQKEFNETMIRYYESGDESAAIPFFRSCLDPRFIEIMKEKP